MNVECHSAMSAVGLENSKVTAIIGGGGKSSLMATLGEEYRQNGETAIMTTSTHIRVPKQDGYMGSSAEELRNLLAERRLLTVGMPILWIICTLMILLALPLSIKSKSQVM